MIKRLTQIIALCLMSVCSYAVNVTFTVDMNAYGGTISQGVFVNGGWNGWCGACNPLFDNGDGTWSVTIDIPAGPHEFKFTVDGWNDQEMFQVDDPCTNSTFTATDVFTNRTITAAEGGVYTAVWNVPNTDCGIAVEQDVTFTVDMSCYGGAVNLANGVFVNGTFNGWCGGCAQMAANGDGTYSITIPLEAADYEFKFTVGGWTDEEALPDGAACTFTTVDGPNTFINRTLSVGASAMAYDAGWNTCSPDCQTALPMELTSFDVVKKGTDAQLEWTTYGDDSNNTFVIEYSTDAINFESIGTVAGVTSRGANTYSYKHYLLSKGTNYYRLKNIDALQAVQYSDLRSLEITTTTKMSINPTISNSDINIQLDDSQLEGVFFIFNILGEKVFEQNISDTRFSVDVNELPIGQYIGVVQKGKDQVTAKFIKTY